MQSKFSKRGNLFMGIYFLFAGVLFLFDTIAKEVPSLFDWFLVISWFIGASSYFYLYRKALIEEQTE